MCRAQKANYNVKAKCIGNVLLRIQEVEWKITKELQILLKKLKFCGCRGRGSSPGKRAVCEGQEP